MTQRCTPAGCLPVVSLLFLCALWMGEMSPLIPVQNGFLLKGCWLETGWHQEFPSWTDPDPEKDCESHRGNWRKSFKNKEKSKNMIAWKSDRNVQSDRNVVLVLHILMLCDVFVGGVWSTLYHLILIKSSPLRLSLVTYGNIIKLDMAKEDV